MTERNILIIRQQIHTGLATLSTAPDECHAYDNKDEQFDAFIIITFNPNADSGCISFTKCLLSREQETLKRGTTQHEIIS